MLKVNQLPKDTNLTKVKVRLPDKTLKMYQDYAGGEKDMWIGGSVMGDFFMSTDPPDKKERRLYPMPELVEPSHILDWEVIEIHGLKDIMHIFDEDELPKTS